MANQYKKFGKRLGVWTASAFLLATVGCAFPQGRYAGDPMLGNFNRPIAATPPVWNGGDPGQSPAYDGGAKLGQSSPDVPTNNKDTGKEKVFIVPTYEGRLGVGKLFGGGGSGGSVSEKSDSPGSSTNRRTTSSFGAHLPVPNDGTASRSSFVAGGAGVLPTVNLVNNRPYGGNQIATSGANIQMAGFAPPAVTATDAMKNPARVVSVEEGQSLLSLCGAKSQRMEQDPTGEWRFTCTLNNGSDNRFYEAKNADQVEAIRAVMVQMQKER